MIVKDVVLPAVLNPSWSWESMVRAPRSRPSRWPPKRA